MIQGITKFKEHFQSYTDHYVLIGGVACVLAMDEAGIDFRATRDFDMVLCVESLEPDFVRAFWDFIHQGGYSIRQKSSGSRQYYRFTNPTDPEYPAMLELFSRAPDAVTIQGESHLTPLPMDEDISSLSAILLDETFYEWILSGKRTLGGIHIVSATHLIPLKARAWIDLSKRKEAGESIDSKVIKKHRNDVFRLFQLLTPESLPHVPETIKFDMKEFLDQAAIAPIPLKQLGVHGIGQDEIVAHLKSIYGVE